MSHQFFHSCTVFSPRCIFLFWPKIFTAAKIGGRNEEYIYNKSSIIYLYVVLFITGCLYPLVVEGNLVPWKCDIDLSSLNYISLLFLHFFFFFHCDFSFICFLFLFHIIELDSLKKYLISTESF